MRALVYLAVTTFTFFFFAGIWWTLKKTEERRLETFKASRQLQVLAPESSLPEAFQQALKQDQMTSLQLNEYDQESFPELLKMTLVSPNEPFVLVTAEQAALLWSQNLLTAFPSSFKKFWDEVALDFRENFSPQGHSDYFLPLLWSVTETDEAIWLNVYGLVRLQRASERPEDRVALEETLEFIFSHRGAALLLEDSTMASTLSFLEGHKGVEEKQKPSYLRQLPFSQLQRNRSP